MPGSVVKWFMILRAYAFPVVILPVLQATLIARQLNLTVAWAFLPLLLIALLSLHSGTNLINDYYDFRNGLDRPDDAPSTWALTKGWLRPQQALSLGIVLLLAAPLIALPVILTRGLRLLIPGVMGLLGGFFYTAPPLNLKYRGSGELLVFALTGPLLTAAVVLGLTGNIPGAAWLGGLPGGFMAAALLYANNLRDRRRDAAVGCHTLAQRLGLWAPWMYVVLIAAAFLALLPLYTTGRLNFTGAVLPLASLPLLYRPVKGAFMQTIPADIDIRTARGLVVFGLLLAGGLALVP